MVEAYGCDPVRLAAPASLRALFDAIVRELALHPVGDAAWHQFPEPGGITGMLMLAESHLTVTVGGADADVWIDAATDVCVQHNPGHWRILTTACALLETDRWS